MRYETSERRAMGRLLPQIHESALSRFWNLIQVSQIVDFNGDGSAIPRVQGAKDVGHAAGCNQALKLVIIELIAGRQGQHRFQFRC
jgi:hypothetical protein